MVTSSFKIIPRGIASETSIIQSFFIQVNYTFYAVIFLVGIYFEICDLVDLTKQKQQIIINNKIEQNLINETGLPLTIKNEN